MKRRTVNPVATLGIMAAVIVVATVLDKAYSLGLVAIGGASLAVCSLVSVTLSAMLYNKFPYAIAAGALFGVTSFVLAYIFPSPIFQNPLASVVPRLFIGIVGFGAYRLARLAAFYKPLFRYKKAELQIKICNSARRIERLKPPTTTRANKKRGLPFGKPRFYFYIILYQFSTNRAGCNMRKPLRVYRRRQRQIPLRVCRPV